jgi:D-alanine-D-alanine ligase
VANRDAQIPGPWNVVVLAGGESHERDISLKSGNAVKHALAGRRHRVSIIDPLEVELAAESWHGVDAVFVALHGRFGEDGAVQSILEKAGVPFTGSDSNTSRVAFSKSASKERFFQCGVQTPPYVLVHQSDDAARIEQQARKLGYPLVVKPDAQGSSFGVSIVHAPEDLPQALAQCFHYDSFGILEAAVFGTEWTLGLIDKRPLPLIQIETEREFFDFRAKYEDETTQYLFEFALPPSVVQEIEYQGCRAANALGTRGIARVDIRLDRYGRPWVLEVNTVPGFTDHSLVPKAAERAGMSFSELCEEAVACCLRDAQRV